MCHMMRSCCHNFHFPMMNVMFYYSTHWHTFPNTVIAHSIFVALKQQGIQRCTPVILFVLDNKRELSCNKLSKLCSAFSLMLQTILWYYLTGPLPRRLSISQLMIKFNRGQSLHFSFLINVSLNPVTTKPNASVINKWLCSSRRVLINVIVTSLLD